MFSSWSGSCRFSVIFAALALFVMPLGAQTPHTARIEGVDDPALLALLQSVSRTLDIEAEVPASLLHLRRRAAGERSDASPKPEGRRRVHKENG